MRKSPDPKTLYRCCQTASNYFAITLIAVEKVAQFRASVGMASICSHLFDEWKESGKVAFLYLGPRIVAPMTRRPGWCQLCEDQRQQFQGFANMSIEMKLLYRRVICNVCMDEIERVAEKITVTIEFFGGEKGEV